jgi:hypothetical protein
MLLVTHLAVGAAIGEAVHGLPGAPAIAFVLGVASHYVLDALPHWEKLSGEKFPDNDTSEPLKKWPRASIKSATIDGILAILFLVYFVWRQPHGAFYVNPVFWGGIGGVLPDFLTNTPGLSKLWAKWPVFKEERYVHNYFHISHESQIHMPRYLGLITQIIAFVGAFCIILFV